MSQPHHEQRMQKYLPDSLLDGSSDWKNELDDEALELYRELGLALYKATSQEEMSASQPHYEQWMQKYLSEPPSQEFKLVPGSGSEGNYLHIYANTSTPGNCRSQGMKECGIYHHKGLDYLCTWGMTNSSIQKEHLESWVRKIEAICSDWHTIDSEYFPSSWKKTGSNGGVTSRFIILNYMTTQQIHNTIQSLVN